MKSSLPLLVAKRFILSNKLRSLFIMFGIAVGVAVQIFIGILIDSLQQSLLDQTIGNSPHITITQNDGEFTEWQTVQEDVENLDQIISVQPVIDGNVFLLKGEETQPALLRGMDNSIEKSIYKFKDKLTEGNLPTSENELIVGTDLQEELNINLGDKITISTPVNQSSDFEIVGIFDFKVASLNKLWIITNIDSAQNFFQASDSISKIELQIEDVFTAPEIATSISESLSNNSLSIANWQEENEQLLSALQSQGSSSLIIQIFVLASVIIAVTSILTITVIQKAKEIGILKAMGQTNRSSSRIFIWQGFFMGLGGVLIGVPLGLGLFMAFNIFATNPDGTPIVEPYIRTTFVILTGLVVLVSATFAGVIPARQSSKLNPIDIIRNG